MEQIWTILHHIGFTLLIAASPILVIVTAVAHSTTNLLRLRWGILMGLPRLQAIGFASAALILAAAWLARGIVGG